MLDDGFGGVEGMMMGVDGKGEKDRDKGESVVYINGGMAGGCAVLKDTVIYVCPLPSNPQPSS
jgi:hypothetical protein